MNALKVQKHTKYSNTYDSHIWLIDSTNAVLPESLPDWVRATAERALKKNQLGVFGLGGEKADQYLFITSKTEADMASQEALRIEAAKLYERLEEHKNKKLFIEASADFALHAFVSFVEALGLSGYAFNRYKSAKKQLHGIEKIGCMHPALNNAIVQRLQNTLDAVNFSKDLVNTPNLHMGVKELKKALKNRAESMNIRFESLSYKQIQQEKMGGLLAVNAGSPDKAGFFILEYKPKDAKNSKPLVVVGKGVVYDTGGYSLKPSTSMLSMKADMAGAAAASGALFHIAAQEHPLHVICLIPATDNRVEKKAIVPDDVITLSDGTTVEVQNTDAEGRLILADALVYAKRFEPMLVIDFATLTGAAAYLTGYFSSAFFSTADDKLTQAMIKAGDTTYERLMHLPLWDEYAKMLDSTIADIRNIGGRVGGMITAAKFLQHFTDYSWMHIDIAGSAFLDNKEAYRSQGATGVGVRLIEQFAKYLQDEV